MNGATFIQRCRGISGLDNVPIVVMSAQAEPDASLQRLEPAPVRAYLAKPFGVEELTAAIESDG
jgi:CheY-like chemotaxis protein